jgi:hypothetical protein
MKRYRDPSYPSVWLILLLSLALPALACTLTEGEATAVPSTETPSPVPVQPTDTPALEPTNPPTPTEAATPKVSPTRRIALPTNTPSPVPPTVEPTVDPKASVPTGNLLNNPGFEGAYQSYLGKTEFNVAQGWIPWFLESGFAPEFKPAEPPYYSRIHGGERAQQYFKTFGTYTAGVYQKVRVAPGVTLRFSIFGQGWSHDGSGDCPIEQSCNPANMGMRIGIDPLGGSNPRADSVEWSAIQSPTNGWAPFTVEAVSENDVVTVFTWASPNAPRRNQDTYWDDASLEAIP